MYRFLLATLLPAGSSVAAPGHIASDWTSIFHRSVELPCTFRFIDGRAGRIESARLELSGTQVEVSGFVAKVGFAELPLGARVEIAVLDAWGNVLERKTTDFVPARIPSPGRWGQPHSHFKAALDARPPLNATVRVAVQEG